MKTKSNRVWVVELNNFDRQRWEPTMHCSSSRDAGREMLREWGPNRYDKFRVRKYVAAKGAK